jgi:hypothetical protein
MVKSFGLTNFQTGMVNAVPFAVAAVGMFAIVGLVAAASTFA